MIKPMIDYISVIALVITLFDQRVFTNEYWELIKINDHSFWLSIYRYWIDQTVSASIDRSFWRTVIMIIIDKSFWRAIIIIIMDQSFCTSIDPAPPPPLQRLATPNSPGFRVWTRWLVIRPPLILVILGLKGVFPVYEYK